MAEVSISLGFLTSHFQKPCFLQSTVLRKKVSGAESIEKAMVFACKFQKMLKILCFFKEKVLKTMKMADSIRDLKIGLKTVANCMGGVQFPAKK